MLLPLKGLFEAHLNVSNLQRSVAFYTELLGLPLAEIFPERRVAFVWVGSPGHSMLGLWEVGNSPQCLTVHLALSVALDDLLTAVTVLRNAGIAPLGFAGEPTDEPTVLAWMPAASIYFRDPDNNLLEFITTLKAPARRDLGVLSWRDWVSRNTEVDCSNGGSDAK
jgi:lactoylglutathione lyase